MGWLSRKSASSILIVSDVIGALAAFLLGASFDAFRSSGSSPLSSGWGILLLFFTLAVNAAFFSVFALYSERALFRMETMDKALIKAVTATAMFLIAAGAVLPVEEIRPGLIFVFWAAMLAWSFASRKIIRTSLVSRGAFAANARTTVIVGTNRRGQKLAIEYLENPALGRRLLGFVDDRWREEPLRVAPDYGLVADFSTFKTFLRNNVVDEAIICLPLKSLYETASAVVADCQEQGVTVTISTHLFNLDDPRMRPTAYAGDLTVTVYSSALDERAMMIKRIMDLVIASAAVVILSPVFAAAWAAIRLTSGPPALFSQERVGLNKRLFSFHKFRSMVTDAETRQKELEDKNETNGATFKMRDDPRITPVGRFLRKTSIDELPQLFNVIKGEMSLVGPRPLPIRDVQRIEKDWPRRRFSVKPGITCIWQISGRNQVPFDGMMAMDLEYVDNWSPWLDIEILLKTIPVVLSGKGAY